MRDATYIYNGIRTSCLTQAVEEHKALPLSSIQNWIILNKKHLQESAKKARKKAIKGVKKITDFFKN